MAISYFWLVCPIYFFPPLLFLFSVSVSLGSWSYFPQKRNKCNDSLLLSQVIFNFFFIYSFFFWYPLAIESTKISWSLPNVSVFFFFFFLFRLRSLDDVCTTKSNNSPNTRRGCFIPPFRLSYPRGSGRQEREDGN